jgi:hypothetical protein
VAAASNHETEIDFKSEAGVQVSLLVAKENGPVLLGGHGLSQKGGVYE